MTQTSPETRRLIIAEHGKMNSEAAAEKHGVSRKTVQRIWHRGGLGLRRNPERDARIVAMRETMTAREIAETIGLHPGTVFDILSRMGRSTAQRRLPADQLAELFWAGHSFASAAQVLCTDDKSVRYAWTRMRLFLHMRRADNPPPPQPPADPTRRLWRGTNVTLPFLPVIAECYA